MDLIHQLNWRYVIKKNGTRISTEQLNLILDNIRSSGFTFGLLPHTILVIDDAEQIDRILPESEQHSSLNKASHLIVFTTWTRIMNDNINELIAHIASSKGLSLANMSDYKETMKLLVKSPNESSLKWCTKQAYIALGIGISAAAGQKIEGAPVEEFDHEEVDRILHLEDKGLASVVMLALGQRDEHESTPVNPKKSIVKKQFLVVN